MIKILLYKYISLNLFDYYYFQNKRQSVIIIFITFIIMGDAITFYVYFE